MLGWVVEWLVREIVTGSLEVSESSEKTSHKVSHSFLSSFSIRLSLWLAWKEKHSERGEAVCRPKFRKGCTGVITPASSLVLTSKISSITYVTVGGS